MKFPFFLLLFFVSPFLKAQPSIAVSDQQTVSLLFPFPVLFVDRGNAELLVQRVPPADHILLVKAASPQLKTTNLSVVTSDGSLYCVQVYYRAELPRWIYEMPPLRRSSVKAYADALLDNRGMLRRPVVRKGSVQLRLAGVYIKDNTLYYQLRLDNRSAVPFDIELLRCYIRDQKQVRRTASQERERTPEYIAGNTRSVAAHGFNVWVLAMDKFTIPDAKYFAIQVLEKEGGRHLRLKIRNRHILQAIPLPDQQ